MSIKNIISDVESIKLDDVTNGSEAWIAVRVTCVRKNSKLGKEMIENGFRIDSYYKGLIYSVSGNLKEKYAKAELLIKQLNYLYGISATILDRAL